MGALSAVSLAGAPYLPGSEKAVLLKLPRVLLADRDLLAELRRRVEADPENAEAAAELAERLVAVGKETGDPRHYGYARAALARWWEDPEAPPEVLRVRAKLKERDHRYGDALADLDRLLQAEPEDVQAWVEVSNIRRVLGDYAGAREAATRLAEFAGDFPVLLCRVPLMAATGEADRAYEILERVEPVARQSVSSAVPWVVTQMAEVARSRGRDDLAEEHFLEGLAANPEDGYLIRAYGDLLLDQGRAEEVIPLSQDRLNDTGVLLRAAIATTKTGDTARATQWRDELAARFEEVRLRGGEPHGRFEARAALELHGDASRALDLALSNWRKQKEARDTRNVLEAALAANAPEAAVPVLAFLAENRCDDAILMRLARQLEGSDDE